MDHANRGRSLRAADHPNFRAAFRIVMLLLPPGWPRVLHPQLFMEVIGRRVKYTSISVDAGTMCRVGHEGAFRFARGEEITTTHGLRAKLSRPLDFLVIADHAEMYGLMPQLLSGDPEILSTEKGKEWYEKLTGGNQDAIFATAMEIVGSLSGDVPPIKNEKAVRNAWQTYTALADRYNEPGRFTALIGYEWTAIGGNNLHRNII